MRKFILTPLIAMLLSFGLTFNLTAQDLMITGVADGPLSGGTPKAIELYVINDVPDLSEYGIAIAANGASSPGSPAFDLPADPATAGEYYYLAGTEQDFIDFFGFSPDFTSGSVSFNGDDAIELYQNGSVVDVFGEVGVDGTGEAWDYLDGWGYRVDDTSPAATFDANDWTFSGTNELEGGTTNADCNQPFPIGTFSMGGGCSPITTFPWTEDFDGDWTSWCWTVIDNDSDGTTWTQDDTYITPHSGDWTAHGMGNADDYLITPEIAVNSANFLIEWYDVVESASYNNTYDVLVSTTDTDPASFTDNLGTFDCTNTDWTKHSLDLSAYDGQNIYIAFHQTYSGASNWGFGIDDVTIREANTETDILTYS
ncbi:MAG: choice-of-anchor J domain-containing protein, partial [Bacteroidales bacterium]